jgi:hypothetical protein
MTQRSSTCVGEGGAALVIALLIAFLLGAIGAALVTLTSTETLISASFGQAQETSYAAEAALDRALHDLATVPDWSLVLAPPPGNILSTFVDGTMSPRAPDGRTLDLARLTLNRQRESDTRAGADAFGANAPAWRLYAHAPLDTLLPPPRFPIPVYLVVWVADDGYDGDGDPTRDSNDSILIRAEGFGSGAAHRAYEARVARTAEGTVRLLAWHEIR